ncbi:MAG: insulinase family protein [Bacteroidales bacterium]|nr:insulinase family protein [Bacteroidales bacterium]MBN2756045.1 insulinase family protein [Bacteroidales bacterium]
MIEFQKCTLENGLRLIVNEDKSTPLVVVNTLYNVGSKYEDPDKTGFAHLFEHLMFGGSKNIADFDKEIQLVGGDNNAFTNNDVTNFYISLPANNIETALWLESDRMLQLDFSQKKLDIEKNVVIEEYKENYLNQPYGDVWLNLRPLAYGNHPYSWPTIGKDISHIQNANIEDVKDFFYKYYAPDNAILSISGNVNFENVKKIVEKWYSDIKASNYKKKLIYEAPKLTKPKFLELKREVPYDAIYKVYQMGKKTNPDFFAVDLLSDVLSNGRSSRLFQKLMIKNPLFASIDAYLSGDIDGGLFIVSGRLSEGVKIKDAEKHILEEIEIIKNELVSDYELEKVKNKVESTNVFGEISIMNKSFSLAMHELVTDAEDFNNEILEYRKVTKEDIKRVANDILSENNCATLYYFAKK